MYTWEFFGTEAEEQADAMPIAAVELLVRLMDALMFDPWEYGRAAGEAVDKGKSLRTLPFGDGLGLVTFQIYDPDRRVLIAKVLWLG